MHCILRGTPNLFKTITVDQLSYPYEMKTNSMLLSFANAGIRPRHTKAVENYMIFDIVQSVFSFALCASVLFKKGRVKKARIITLRRSPYGSFIVPNAIWWILALLSAYQMSWSGFCAYIIYIQRTSRPLAGWLFYVPLPWLPMILGAFYFAYGFVLTCSPRSPISNLADARKKGSSADSLSWIYLPLPRSASVMNAFMVGVGVVMIAFNVVIIILNGKQMRLTHKSGHNAYEEVLIKHHTQEWLDAAPTQGFLDLIKVAWCDLANIYRLCCLGIASYMVLIVIIVAMLVLYAIPNHIYMMDHLVRIYPDETFEQPQKRTVLNLLRALWKIGLPRNLQGRNYSAFKKTWMMVMVGHSQVFLVLAGVMMFAVPPYYLFVYPWHDVWHGVSVEAEVTFMIAFCITAALLAAGWITAFSGILTFDDIFRAVSGLGVTPVEETSCFAKGNKSAITSQQRRSLGLSSTSPATASSLPSSPTLLPSPGPLRAMASFTPSTISEEEDEKKDMVDENPYKHSGNTVLVVTETSVRVDYDDDVDPRTDGPANPSSAARAPYSFLGRKRFERDI